MSPYQQIFSTNAVLSVWRNLRNTKDHNDLLLTFQYQKDDARGHNGKDYGKKNVVETTHELSDSRAVDVGGKSLGFIVPWRSLQAQRKELKEKEKELAEALVMLAGEVAFTGMSQSHPHISTSVSCMLTTCYRPVANSSVFSYPESPHSDPPSCCGPIQTNVEN
jgi:hypothetical protein